MMTAEDINKIIRAQAEVFPTKDDFDALREDFSKLQTSVEAFAVQSKESAEEIAVAHHRITTTETWIKQASSKIRLDYKP